MSDQIRPTPKDAFEEALIRNMDNVARVYNQNLTTRTELFQRLLDPRKDIRAECGHPVDIQVEDYSNVYERNGVGARVVQVYPDETWKTLPQIFEDTSENKTDFEEDIDRLQEELAILSVLRQVDVLSGVGHFGIILLGFNDGAPMSKPVNPGDGLELLYARALDNAAVSIDTWETNESSPRFGHPLTYSINFTISTDRLGVQLDPSVKEGVGLIVHWTRVRHVVDNMRNSPVYGEPRMKACFNRILDVDKIAGGSAEMFWKGGFPGIALETQPGLTEQIDFDPATVTQEMDKYMNGLQRYIALLGMSARTLEVQISDPKNFYEMQMRLIAMTKAVPWRVLMGSEAAQLASDQDSTNWNTRLNARRTNHVNPFIIRPFIDQMIEYGVVRPPANGRYHIKWDDLNAPTDLDRAKVADLITKALSTYVQVGADILLPPRDFLMQVLNFDATVVDRVMAEIDVDALAAMRDTDDDRLLKEPGESNGDIENQ